MRWRQGGKNPHTVYEQRGPEPDRRPQPDGDRPLGMFLNPTDAEVACRAVNTLHADPIGGDPVQVQNPVTGPVEEVCDGMATQRAGHVLRVYTDPRLDLDVVEVCDLRDHLNEWLTDVGHRAPDMGVGDSER